MGMTAITVALAVVIAIVVAAAIFTGLDVFFARWAEKNACRGCLLCETKKFEIMNAIKFAKAHMREYFRWMGRKVRVIGYDTTGDCESVIVDHPNGWAIEFIDPVDVINRDLCETGRCKYVSWEDLK